MNRINWIYLLIALLLLVILFGRKILGWFDTMLLRQISVQIRSTFGGTDLTARNKTVSRILALSDERIFKLNQIHKQNFGVSLQTEIENVKNPNGLLADDLVSRLIDNGLYA